MNELDLDGLEALAMKPRDDTPFSGMVIVTNEEMLALVERVRVAEKALALLALPATDDNNTCDIELCCDFRPDAEGLLCVDGATCDYARKAEQWAIAEARRALGLSEPEVTG
jgi:hypothetical protein